MFRVFVPESKDEEPGYYGGFLVGHLSVGDRDDAMVFPESEPALECCRILSALLNVEAHVEQL
jgi:hypothetical protein